MRELFKISDELKSIAAEVISEHDSLKWLERVRIGYLWSDKEKHKSGGQLVLAECMKVRAVYQMYVPLDFIIVFYEPNIIGLNRDQLKILMHHELLHIGIKEQGELMYVVNPHDVEEFREIIEQYGLDWTRR